MSIDSMVILTRKRVADLDEKIAAAQERFDQAELQMVRVTNTMSTIIREYQTTESAFVFTHLDEHVTWMRAYRASDRSRTIGVTADRVAVYDDEEEDATAPRPGVSDDMYTLAMENLRSLRQKIVETATATRAAASERSEARKALQDVSSERSRLQKFLDAHAAGGKEGGTSA